MFLRDFCIQRPVFAIVINLFLLLGGFYAIFTLPVRNLPQFDVPVVIVTTALPGGSAELIERSVTTIIERAVSQVNGIDYMTSTSSANLSLIQMVFKGNLDPAKAAEAARAKVNEAQPLLPTGTQPPVVQQISLDNQPVLYLSFRDPNRSALQTTDLINRRVRPMLSLVPGVSSLQISGERKYSLRVRLDRFRLASQNLTVDDVMLALQAQNVELPGGEIIGDERRVSILARTLLNSPTEFGDLVVRSVGSSPGMLGALQSDSQTQGDYPIRLRDVAEIDIAPESIDTGVRIDGAEAVAVGILRQSDANPVDISNAVRQMLPQLRQALPSGMSVAIPYDDATFIDASIREVFDTILITIGLVVLVVLLSLVSLRSSFIALVAIPLSLGGGLAFLAMAGYSLNVFTLLAFVLVIGLVVDDAIVEVENIQRHVDAGMDSLTAGFKGSREIGFAVIAMTLTLAAVYAPIGLLPGMIGSLFREFAFTLAMTLIFSGFVAMTLSAMLCSRLLRPQSENRLAQWVDGLFHRLGAAYGRTLSFSLRHRWLVALIAIGAVAWGFTALSKLPGELAPVEDEGYLLIMFTGPQDASPAYMNARAAAIEQVLTPVPERQMIMTLTGIPTLYQGVVFMLLKPWEQRQRTAMQIQAGLESALAEIPGVRVAAVNPDPLGGGGQAPVQFVLKSTLEYAQLNEAIQPFLTEARQLPALQAISIDLNLDAPVENVEVNRDQAADLGIQMSTIANVFGRLLGQQKVNQFNWEGTLYPVILDLQNRGMLAAEKLEQIYLRTPGGDMVPLSSIASIQRGVGAASLSHFDQLRSVTISANLASGQSLATVAKDLEAIAARTLPLTIQTDWSGAVRQMSQANASMGLVFVLALGFIYLTLAAQFESFRDPLIILSVAPLSIAGAGLALQFSGGTLNLYSGIGFITLIGLIAKHGILITEFTNQLRDAGRPKLEALVEAATIRLRPILMTTAAMVLGALPLAMATGAGAVSRRDIGWVIGGGMLFGTLLSLFVIPTVYSWLSRKERAVLPPIPPDL
ncbi:MAG: efflux RND transporter permease subunit [Candidatus Contendobacter sp.]|jgi:multidrug efflux pump|nr:efflux RND transporter permease subunit [Gammaproteobacteria bacterium]MCC8992588.1 efflux RND transporter permease subunit [Candidatus Contendobacter sp.]